MSTRGTSLPLKWFFMSQSLYMAAALRHRGGAGGRHRRLSYNLPKLMPPIPEESIIESDETASASEDSESTSSGSGDCDTGIDPNTGSEPLVFDRPRRVPDGKFFVRETRETRQAEFQREEQDEIYDCAREVATVLREDGPPVAEGYVVDLLLECPEFPLDEFLFALLRISAGSANFEAAAWCTDVMSEVGISLSKASEFVRTMAQETGETTYLDTWTRLREDMVSRKVTALTTQGKIGDAQDWAERAVSLTTEARVSLILALRRRGHILESDGWLRTWTANSESTADERRELYGGLLEGCAIAGDYRSALLYFEECQSSGIDADERNVKAMMEAAAEAGDDLGASWWYQCKESEDLKNLPFGKENMYCWSL